MLKHAPIRPVLRIRTRPLWMLMLTVTAVVCSPPNVQLEGFGQSLSNGPRNSADTDAVSDQNSGNGPSGSSASVTPTSTSSSSTTSTTIATTDAMTSSPSSSPQVQPTQSSKSGLSVGAKVGIGVAIPIAVISIAAGSFFLWFHIRRRRQSQQAQRISQLYEAGGSEKVEAPPKLHEVFAPTSEKPVMHELPANSVDAQGRAGNPTGFDNVSAVCTKVLATCQQRTQDKSASLQAP